MRAASHFDAGVEGAYVTIMPGLGPPRPMPDFAARIRNWLNPLVPARLRSDIPVVPVVRLTGIIGLMTPLRPGLMLSTTARSLERAFSVRHARAVALSINSPGGSPAQSHLIFRRIRQWANEKKLPVLAFVEDVGASGGYMLACAADEIICDPFSIVGSIGVVGGTFGFTKLMDKIGVERRLYTAGEPPGELTRIATARALRIANARSSERATVDSISPGRSGVLTPITPERRTTGTTGMSGRKRAGTSRLRNSSVPLRMSGIGWLAAVAITQLGIIGTRVKAGPARCARINFRCAAV